MSSPALLTSRTDCLVGLPRTFPSHEGLVHGRLRLLPSLRPVSVFLDGLPRTSPAAEAWSADVPGHGRIRPGLPRASPAFILASSRPTPIHDPAPNTASSPTHGGPSPPPPSSLPTSMRSSPVTGTSTTSASSPPFLFLSLPNWSRLRHGSGLPPDGFEHPSVVPQLSSELRSHGSVSGLPRTSPSSSGCPLLHRRLRPLSRTLLQPIPTLPSRLGPLQAANSDPSDS